MVKEKKTFAIDLYIEKVSKLLPYPISKKEKALEALKEDVIEAMKDSKSIDPSMVFGNPEITAKNIGLSQDWCSMIGEYSKRILAYIIDLIISLLVFYALVYYSFRPSFISLLNTWSSEEIAASTKFGVLFLIIVIEIPLAIIGIIFYFGYFVLFEGYYSTTIGKKIVGLLVVDTTGIKISWKQSFLRNIPKLNPLWVPILILEIISSKYIQKNPNQRIFDIVAGTKVVKRNLA